MRIAFYAPLKPPDHPRPSGDRRMARLLIRALEDSGHKVDVVSRFRSREGAGDRLRQDRLQAVGGRLAQRLIRRLRAATAAQRPDLWFTYHLYYKAPDWLGPAVSQALDIPYVVAEASHAPKRAESAWAPGHRAVARALGHADAILAINPADIPCVAAAIADPSRLAALAPFLEPDAALDLGLATGEKSMQRKALSDRFDLDISKPWILTVAMMRPGDKLASYRVLGQSLAALRAAECQSIIVGDGPARPDVEAALAPAASGSASVVYAGEQAEPDLGPFYAAADLFAWPAVNEAYGMAILQAQAMGLPVIAGNGGGVPAIVGDGTTGLLVDPLDTRAFAGAVDALLADADRRAEMGRAAASNYAKAHSFAAAARSIDKTLVRVFERRQP